MDEGCGTWPQTLALLWNCQRNRNNKNHKHQAYRASSSIILFPNVKEGSSVKRNWRKNMSRNDATTTTGNQRICHLAKWYNSGYAYQGYYARTGGQSIAKWRKLQYDSWTRESLSPTLIQNSKKIHIPFIFLQLNSRLVLQEISNSVSTYMSVRELHNSPTQVYTQQDEELNPNNKHSANPYKLFYKSQCYYFHSRLNAYEHSFFRFVYVHQFKYVIIIHSWKTEIPTNFRHKHKNKSTLITQIIDNPSWIIRIHLHYIIQSITAGATMPRHLHPMKTLSELKKWPGHV